MSYGHVSTCLCFPMESVAVLWLRITYWVTWSSCVFSPDAKYSVPRIIKLLYLGHLLHIWAYTKKLYVFSCWVSECFQVSSAFRQGPSKLIILLDFLIFFQVICNYIETIINLKSDCMTLNVAFRWVFLIIRVFYVVPGNSCAIDQWMHFVSLNLK